MKAFVDIDESLLKLASERTGQTEKSALVNMGLRALVNRELQIETSPTASATASRRTLGGWEDVWVADDFDDTPPEIIDRFMDDDV